MVREVPIVRAVLVVEVAEEINNTTVGAIGSLILQLYKDINREVL